MGFVKKAVFGAFATLFIFIGASMLSSAGITLFDPEFLTLGGLILLLSMGFVETNFVFYE